MNSCGRRGGAFRLECAGQESADHGPVYGGDVGIAGDLACAAGTPDEAVIEESDNRARCHTQEYFDHLFFIQRSDFFSHWFKSTISANAYIVKFLFILKCIVRHFCRGGCRVKKPSSSSSPVSMSSNCISDLPPINVSPVERVFRPDITLIYRLTPTEIMKY